MKETLQPGAVYRDPQDDNALFVCAGETDQLGETPIVNWNGTHGWAWGVAALYVKEADSIQEYTGASCVASSDMFGIWMPIETAPHDFTWVLGYEEDTDEVGILIFDSNPEEECPDEHADVWSDGYRIWNPTHWMPLPSPPNK